jgi:hypothetical protein
MRITTYCDLDYCVSPVQRLRFARGGAVMQHDERDLLQVLKEELSFVERDGYGLSPTFSWRPQCIFEDSPTCPNYGVRDNPHRCSECVLIQLVPLERRSERIPCRHIPLNSFGETLESLYRYDDQSEIEKTVANWLRATIRRLEQQREAAKRERTEPLTQPQNLRCTPLYQKQHPKCANSACPTAFHWTGGGKFFRFRPHADPALDGNTNTDAARGVHRVRHYWLCERCSHAFTLLYDIDSGVRLKPLWLALPATTKPEQTAAAGSTNAVGVPEERT